jgi:hypothetical protein
MAIVLDGTSGITNDSGYTGDGVSFADSTPANTLVTTSGGNVGIGTSSPATGVLLDLKQPTAGTDLIVGLSAGTGARAQIRSIAFSDANSSALSFHTTSGGSTNERARIDSSGNLLVGRTSGFGERLSVSSAAGNNEGANVTHNGNYSGLAVIATSGTFADNVLLTSTTRAASSSFQFIRSVANTVDQFRVTGNGVIYAQNATVQSISDQRLKENVRDAADGLDVITALRPVRYDWKQGYGNDRKDQLGFIAQEVEAVFPEAVAEWQVGKNDETVYKTVGPGAFIPVLVKAIQEQQALIASQSEIISAQQTALTVLTARVEAQEVRLTSLEGAQA